MTEDAQGSKDAFDVNARVLSSQYMKLFMLLTRAAYFAPFRINNCEMKHDWRLTKLVGFHIPHSFHQRCVFTPTFATVAPCDVRIVDLLCLLPTGDIILMEFLDLCLYIEQDTRYIKTHYIIVNE